MTDQSTPEALARGFRELEESPEGTVDPEVRIRWYGSVINATWASDERLQSSLEEALAQSNVRMVSPRVFYEQAVLNVEGWWENDKLQTLGDLARLGAPGIMYRERPSFGVTGDVVESLIDISGVDEVEPRVFINQVDQLDQVDEREAVAESAFLPLRTIISLTSGVAMLATGVSLIVTGSDVFVSSFLAVAGAGLTASSGGFLYAMRKRSG